MRLRTSGNAVLNIENKVPYIEFPVLKKIDFITHGFSTKLGGVSIGEFESMNLGYSRGDKKEHVDKNYKLIGEAIGFHWEDLVATDQIHEAVIRVVTEEDKGKGIIRERNYSGIDGFITNCKNVPLVTYYADCVPLYMVDKKKKAIGFSHSGWRGTVKKIGKLTIEAMKEAFDTNPEDVVVVIGPSICQSCYEVSKEVADEFEKVFPRDGIKDILLQKDNEKYDLNLWEANKQIFKECGVREENIHISGVCTYCNQELMFSHRATGANRGSLAAFLMIK